MPIQILPPQLANQIAAGEVVERPASVVKELVENSIDAGATQIQIDIDKGGHKRIQIRDNGKGIAKQELGLALSRHATSKIQTLDDLEQIQSLGFRGEALASISSVSRLKLTSRPADQREAWQAECEGRDMGVNITPAAHPQGTTVLVEDLFFNTPARRKFLRAEKTEFSHIDEVIRRIALCRHDVGFILRHNGKVLRNYPISTDDALARLIAVGGNALANQLLEIEGQYQDMRLRGWVLPPRFARIQPDLQYFYVNGRVMKDRLILHAMRQAMEGQLPEGRHPGYVLQLDIDPKSVDVNVHPAKHEVRFHQARLVHDYILSTLQDVMGEKAPLSDSPSPPPASAHQYDTSYIRPLTEVQSSPPRGGYQSQSGAGQRGAVARSLPRVVGPGDVYSSQTIDPDTSNNTLLIGLTPSLWLVPASAPWLVTTQGLMAGYLEAQWQCQEIIAQPLLMPVAVELPAQQAAKAASLEPDFAALGISLSVHGNKVIIKATLAMLRELDWATLLTRMLDDTAVDTGLARVLLNQLMALTLPASSARNGRLSQWLASLAQDQRETLLARWGKRPDAGFWEKLYASA